MEGLGPTNLHFTPATITFNQIAPTISDLQPFWPLFWQLLSCVEPF